MSDLISREDAVEAIKRFKHRLEGCGLTYKMLLEVFEEELPSAETHGMGSEDTKILKEFLLMIPTAYLLESLGVSTFEELMEEPSTEAYFTDGNKIGEWIPCYARLPKTGDSVLVTYSDGDVGIIWSARPQVWAKYEEAKNLIFPVAWMPLPKPYREESEA